MGNSRAPHWTKWSSAVSSGKELTVAGPLKVRRRRGDDPEMSIFVGCGLQGLRAVQRELQMLQGHRRPGGCRHRGLCGDGTDDAVPRLRVATSTGRYLNHKQVDQADELARHLDGAVGVAIGHHRYLKSAFRHLRQARAMSRSWLCALMTMLTSATGPPSRSSAAHGHQSRSVIGTRSADAQRPVRSYCVQKMIIYPIYVDYHQRSYRPAPTPIDRQGTPRVELQPSP